MEEGNKNFRQRRERDRIGGDGTPAVNICGSLCWLPWNQEAVAMQRPHCVGKNPFCASICRWQSSCHGKALGDEGSTQDYCREQRTALRECPSPCFRVLHMQLPQATPEMNPNAPARAQHRTDSTEKWPSASHSAQQTPGGTGNPWCSSQW